jgi:WD40 repeat protein
MKRLFCLVPMFALTAFEGGTLRFPVVERMKDYTPQGAGVFRITERLSTGVPENIFSVKYLPDGKRVLVTTVDFNIYLFDLESKQVVWKVDNKMKYEAEFDGPRLFDVSPDGKYFLTQWQVEPERQGAERALLVRSTQTGAEVRRFNAEDSRFYSVSANVDYRKPSAAEQKERTEAGLGKNWVYTVDTARYIENGSQIIVGYKHNMQGPNLYDRSVKIYDAGSAKKLREFQLTCDKESANWDQPAGFTIGHLKFPFVYSAKRKSVIFGTAHGRIHEIDFATMDKNAKTPLVENKPAGKVLYNPIADSSELAEKNFQSVRFMMLSKNESVLLASAGTENYTIQIYGYNLGSKKEILKSSIFEAGRLDALGANTLVVGASPGGKFLIADIKEGRLLFHAGSQQYFSGSIFDANPVKDEVLTAESGTELVLLRP